MSPSGGKEEPHEVRTATALTKTTLRITALRWRELQCLTSCGSSEYIRAVSVAGALRCGVNALWCRLDYFAFLAALRFSSHGSQATVIQLPRRRVPGEPHDSHVSKLFVSASSSRARISSVAFDI